MPWAHFFLFPQQGPNHSYFSGLPYSSWLAGLLRLKPLPILLSLPLAINDRATSGLILRKHLMAWVPSSGLLLAGILSFASVRPMPARWIRSNFFTSSLGPLLRL